MMILVFGLVDMLLRYSSKYANKISLNFILVRTYALMAGMVVRPKRCLKLAIALMDYSPITGGGNSSPSLPHVSKYIFSIYLMQLLPHITNRSMCSFLFRCQKTISKYIVCNQ